MVLGFSLAAGLVFGLFWTSVVLELAFVLCFERLNSASSLAGGATGVRSARDDGPDLLKELLGGEGEVDILSTQRLLDICNNQGRNEGTG